MNTRHPNDSDFIVGYHAVKEFLEKQPERISKILISHHPDKNIHDLTMTARLKSVPFHFVPSQKIKSLSGKNENILAFISPVSLLDISELKKKAEQLTEGIFVILDEIVDPNNLGAIIRSAVCFGANGVVIQKWRAATLTASVYKTSAGAVSHIDTFSVPNIKNAIKVLKDLSYLIVGSSSEGTTELRNFTPPKKCALIIGSENSGIRKTVSELCDVVVHIPQRNTKISSLNASVSAGILLYSITSC